MAGRRSAFAGSVNQGSKGDGSFWLLSGDRISESVQPDRLFWAKIVSTVRLCQWQRRSSFAPNPKNRYRSAGKLLPPRRPNGSDTPPIPTPPPIPNDLPPKHPPP